MSARAVRPDGALRTALAGVAIVLLAALAATAGVFDRGLAIDVAHRLAAPSAIHWMGTDPLGRDVLSMLAAGARVSIGIALAAVGGGALVGIPLGLYAGVAGGVAEALITRVADLVFAVPPLLLALLLAGTLGSGGLNTVTALAIFNVPVFARVARSGALALARRDFVLAAQLAGKGRARIALEHLLPNLSGLLVVQASIQLALAITAESGLAYVGVGVAPPAPSWGRMLSEAQTLAAAAPWLVWYPGGVIAATVLSFSVLGERLRAALGPRTEG